MFDNQEKIDIILNKVMRPGRYMGNEVNVIKKDWEKMEVHFALAFPDTYEIGMSHIGMEILYNLLNQIEWMVAERVFSPWIDMETEMRREGVSLFSLESKHPIRFFDILGISLQYELQYTNVLNLLSLAGIPIRSCERGRKDPFVIGGGPCAYNPEPLADFLDCVVLGDGEEVAIEIAELVRRGKRERWSREETLEHLSQLKGVYVPKYYQMDPETKQSCPIKENVPDKVETRSVEKLLLQNYPLKPLVPLIEVAHDRFSLEIMRGCTRGCRFCNAGMVYRPLRCRSVNDLISQTQAVLASTGYDEVSLVSLSTSDFPDLIELLVRIQSLYHDQGISISFPSLRSDTFTPAIADFAQGLRRSGLTLAPEAGTQRLRNIINKCNREEDLLKSLEIAYQRDWRRVKLYFMIGLPTENQEDIQGIVTLVEKVVHLGRRFGKKEIHVSISPFSPKPHTPFQWEAQNDIEDLENKIKFLTRAIRWKEVKLSWRDPRVSQMETIFGRGDRRLGEVIYHAWQQGARFDAWSDQFCYDTWQKAFNDCSVDMTPYLQKKSLSDPLPWQHLNNGISIDFLKKEYQKSTTGAITEDCQQVGCHKCGLMNHGACQELLLNKKNLSRNQKETNLQIHYGRKTKRVQSKPLIRRVRLGFRKGPEVRFTSHLDTIRIFTRALRRARINVALSKGYRAHPKISFGPPLPLGYISRAEYFDVGLLSNPPNHFDRILNKYLPSGFHVFDYKILVGHEPALNRVINIAWYRIIWQGSSIVKELESTIDDFLVQNTYWTIRREKKIDIRPFVKTISIQNGGIDLHVRIGSEGTVKAEEVFQAVWPHYEVLPLQMTIERIGLFIEEKGKRLTPMEVV